jgi:hypothetical protein
MTNEEKKPEMTVVPGHVGYSPDYKSEKLEVTQPSKPFLGQRLFETAPALLAALTADPIAPPWSPVPSGRIPVLIEVTIKLVMDFPASYAVDDCGAGERGEDPLKDNVEFYLNESSSCSGNELRKLAARLEERSSGCACNHIESKFVRVATEADQETYHYEPEE